MAPLLKELSSIEVEPLQIVENAPESEQKWSLDSITAVSGNFEVDALLTGTLPIINDACSRPPVICCCCCCAC